MLFRCLAYFDVLKVSDISTGEMTQINKQPCLEYLNSVLTIFDFVAFNKHFRLDTSGTNQPAD